MAIGINLRDEGDGWNSGYVQGLRSGHTDGIQDAVRTINRYQANLHEMMNDAGMRGGDFAGVYRLLELLADDIEEQ